MMRHTLAPFLLAALPAFAAAPEAAATLASDLARNAFPADLRQMRLMTAVSAGTDVVIIAQPAIGGALPDPADATAFLCDRRAVPAFLDQGGTIRVLMVDKPFLTLSTCEGL